MIHSPLRKDNQRALADFEDQKGWWAVVWKTGYKVFEGHRRLAEDFLQEYGATHIEAVLKGPYDLEGEAEANKHWRVKPTKLG